MLIINVWNRDVFYRGSEGRAVLALHLAKILEESAPEALMNPNRAELRNNTLDLTLFAIRRHM